MSRKTMLILGIFLFIGCVGAMLLQADSNPGVISKAEMARIYGGVKLATCASNSKCETHDCQDIECSKGQIRSGSNKKTIWLKGNDEDMADVTTCYQVTGETCTPGDWSATNCQGDGWDSQGCFGTPDYPDWDVWGEECS